jgi:hypothetical protein
MHVAQVKEALDNYGAIAPDPIHRTATVRLRSFGSQRSPSGMHTNPHGFRLVGQIRGDNRTHTHTHTMMGHDASWQKDENTASLYLRCAQPSNPPRSTKPLPLGPKPWPLSLCSTSTSLNSCHLQKKRGVATAVRAAAGNGVWKRLQRKSSDRRWDPLCRSSPGCEGLSLKR